MGVTRKWRTASTARWRTVAIASVSLGLHGLILGPLALATLGDEREPRPEIHPYDDLPIDLILVPRRDPQLPDISADGSVKSSLVGAHASPASDPRADGPTSRLATPSATLSERIATAPSLEASPASAAASVDVMADTGRVQPGPPPAPGPPPLICRRLDQLPPIEREICAARQASAASARIGQRRLNRSEAAREGGFAEQAAANAAWSAYRRSEDDGQSYPGLRSMLKHY